MPNAIPNQISVASLWTEDVPTTVRFYTEVIGLQLCPVKAITWIRLTLMWAAPSW